jgi:hypothetical protein
MSRNRKDTRSNGITKQILDPCEGITFPYFLRTQPMTMVTKEEHLRLTKGRNIRRTHIPATHPFDEGGAQSGPDDRV